MALDIHAAADRAFERYAVVYATAVTRLPTWLSFLRSSPCRSRSFLSPFWLHCGEFVCSSFTAPPGARVWRDMVTLQFLFWIARARYRNSFFQSLRKLHSANRCRWSAPHGCVPPEFLPGWFCITPAFNWFCPFSAARCAYAVPLRAPFSTPATYQLLVRCGVIAAVCRSRLELTKTRIPPCRVVDAQHTVAGGPVDLHTLLANITFCRAQRAWFGSRVAARHRSHRHTCCARAVMSSPALFLCLLLYFHADLPRCMQRAVVPAFPLG